MTEPVARSAFTDRLDREQLEAIVARIERLEPLAAELRELHTRRSKIERRLGMKSNAQHVRELLEQHPGGLTRRLIAEETGLQPSQVSGALTEMRDRGETEQPGAGIHRLARPGDAAQGPPVGADPLPAAD